MSYETQAAIAPWFGLAILVAINSFTFYQLWEGKASCWPSQTRSKVSNWWVFRAEQPFSFWFRVALWGLMSAFLDGGILLLVLKKP